MLQRVTRVENILSTALHVLRSIDDEVGPIDQTMTFYTSEASDIHDRAGVPMHCLESMAILTIIILVLHLDISRMGSD